MVVVMVNGSCNGSCNGGCNGKCNGNNIGFSWTNCNLRVRIPNMNLYVLWKLYHSLFPYTCVSAKLI